MEQVFRLCRDRYPGIKRVALCLALTIGCLLIITDYCRAQESDQPVEYETPGILDAYEILPSNLLEGKNFWMDRRVVSDGLDNRYTLNSHFGKFEVTGEGMLRIRQQEIRAIESLREIKKTGAFSDAAKAAVTGPLEGTKSLITDPVNSVKGVGKGTGKFFNRIGEMTKGGRGDQEEGYSKELLGFSAIKREYAHELGVDVYSSNGVLQKELNSVAWAGLAGNFTVKMALGAVKGASAAAHYAIKATTFINNMNQILLDNSPEDLQRINRDKLKQMGVKEPVIKEFIKHPKYSPRHQTILVHALTEMQGVKNREQFIKQALHAEYEVEAFLYQRMAEMLLGYHVHVKPIKEIIPVLTFAVGYTSDQTIVAAIELDILYWTRLADQASADLVRLDLTGRPVKKTEFWVTGSLTTRARQEFKARGLVLRERAGEVLLPPSTQ
ncbi:MAG: hypothetical protein GY774_04305 [Planctomycetes bacterium]|nr:hypothetical protein [Planctomycetota bacterium]